jgi:MraZ protein
MYFGQFHHTIDAKGRVSVPAQFRDFLAGDLRLVMAPFTVLGERCVDVHPWPEWEKLLERFSHERKFNPEAIKFEMGYLARSHRVDIDSAGRILVPPSLRQHAGLTRDIVFLGAERKFRMMDKKKFGKVMDEHDAEAADNRGIYGTLDV